MVSYSSIVISISSALVPAVGPKAQLSGIAHTLRHFLGLGIFSCLSSLGFSLIIRAFLTYVIILSQIFSRVNHFIKESRGIYANVKRVASQVLSCALGELLLMLLEIIIFGYPALTALPILWLNLVVGFAVIIGLSFEKAGDDVMHHPPFAKKGRFFTKDYTISILWQGVLLAVIGIVSYAIGGSTMLFATLVLSEISLAFSVRSENSIFKVGFHTNKGMLLALGVAIFTLLIISGPLHTVFMLKENLTTAIVFELILFSLIPLAVSEAVKFLKAYLLKRGK